MRDRPRRLPTATPHLALSVFLAAAGIGLAPTVEATAHAAQAKATSTLYVISGRPVAGSSGADSNAPIRVGEANQFTIAADQRAKVGIPRKALKGAIGSMPGKLHVTGFQPILIDGVIHWAVAGHVIDGRSARATIVVVDAKGHVVGTREHAAAKTKGTRGWKTTAGSKVSHSTSGKAPAMDAIESKIIVPQAVQQATAGLKAGVIFVQGSVMMERAEACERPVEGGALKTAQLCTRDGLTPVPKAEAIPNFPGAVMMERAEEDEMGVDLWVFAGPNAVLSALDAVVNNGPSVLLATAITRARQIPTVSANAAVLEND